MKGKSLLSLDETATELSVTNATLNRWHHMNWAKATDYEQVSVPGVGPVSARRWTISFVEELRGRRDELLAQDAKLRALRPFFRKYGKAYAQATFDKTPKPSHPEGPPAIVDAAIDQSGIPVCAKDASVAFLRQSHAHVKRLLKTELEIDIKECDLEVSWIQLTSREAFSPFNFGASQAGRRGDRYFVKIMAGVRLDNVCRTQDMLLPIFERNEYEFISKDPEIGDRTGITAYQMLLFTYLHEISHVAALWLKANKAHLPESLIIYETKARRKSDISPEQADKSGHGLNWSAIYRTLTRKT